MAQNLSINAFTSDSGWTAIYVEGMKAMIACGSGHPLRGDGATEREAILSLENQFFYLAVRNGKLVWNEDI